MSNEERVYSIIKKIPKGKVLRYGDVAALSGVSNPRVIGNILHRNQNPTLVPCHRVINAAGRLAPAYAFGGPEIQKKKLQSEGVIFRGDFVDLKQSLWQPK